ncbi:NAD(P)-dependent alcohol dehydrogenase [Agromyces seonyuensis]|uniref:Zinc-binding dehydrogenase n=1 Tax=Agromyces seonyuensis TaxID=2662446 RepID=A0A6I4P2M3_9MICO|nr:NAD(P)-dependent alcohol dehydrogenase [Agromyces seonyuensis]MWB98995.1 zinc-binding dehydrogenase [Agromyces seonyuensis]
MSTMHAWVRHDYGGPDRLERAVLPVPAPAAGEVLVRVTASAVNSADLHLLRGEPRVVRLAFGARRPRAAQLGRDCAGVVEAVGPGVDPSLVGTLVHGEADAAWAEYAVLPADVVVPVPDALDETTAAAVPLAGVTAVQAMRRLGDVSGRRMLVTGASGCVGLYVVQLARAAGAHVTAVASARRADLVRSAGAEHVVDRHDPADDPGDEFGAIVDVMAVRPLSEVLPRLAADGVYLSVGGDGTPVLGPLPRIAGLAARGPFTRRRLRSLAARRSGADLADLDARIDRGEVRPMIDRVVDFADVPDALRAFEAGEANGRLLIRIAA